MTCERHNQDWLNEDKRNISWKTKENYLKNVKTTTDNLLLMMMNQDFTKDVGEYSAIPRLTARITQKVIVHRSFRIIKKTRSKMFSFFKKFSTKTYEQSKNEPLGRAFQHIHITHHNTNNNNKVVCLHN